MKKKLTSLPATTSKQEKREVLEKYLQQLIKADLTSLRAHTIKEVNRLEAKKLLRLTETMKELENKERELILIQLEQL